jgi:hypothetical protein
MVVEKDYALSYLLAGIAANPDLSGTLIFKGGTALKKLYFGDYRFSEDLDFSAVDAPRGQALEEAVREAVNVATKRENAGPGQDSRQPPNDLMQGRARVKIVKNFGKLCNGLQRLNTTCLRGSLTTSWHGRAVLALWVVGKVAS